LLKEKNFAAFAENLSNLIKKRKKKYKDFEYSSDEADIDKVVDQYKVWDSKVDSD